MSIGIGMSLRSPAVRKVPVRRRAPRAVTAVLALLGACAIVSSASAQFWGDPFYRPRPQRAIPQQQSPFGGFFGPPAWQPPPPPAQSQRPSRAQMGDFSKAPAPRKPDTPPTVNVMVIGDGMADWLAYGLEEAFTDNPEFGVVRKIRTTSGLIRNETRSDSYDWVQSARDMIAAEKPHFVVMMIGLHDRQSIRERRPAARPPGQPGQPGQPNQPTQQGQQKPPTQPNQAAQQGQPKPPGQPAQAAPQGQQGQPDAQNPENAEGPTQPEQPPAEGGPTTAATHEFRSEKWGELYAKRIDDTIAAMKSRGIPVLWVGLPPIRGQRSRSDLTYLNDLYRARAQKAGITFVDVWEGFVDEDGNFSLRGPDYNGQIRQLRSADGTYFTKAGALKLGHYLEREIQRLHATRATPVALPVPEPQQPAAPATRPGGPAQRPVAGPVVPLTGASSGSEELAGSGPAAARAAATDPVAARVLVNGEPAPAPSGRADDFRWPRPEADDSAIIPAVATPAAAPAPQRPTKKGSAPAEKGASKKSGQAGQAASSGPNRPVR